MDKKRRPRILYKPKGTSPLIVDELEFVENKCSVKARLVKVMGLTINIYIWFDQHYYHRHHTGDCNGKRENINPETIEDFVTKAVPYLVYLVLSLKDFLF